MPVHFTDVRWTFTHEKFPKLKFTVQEWYNSDIRIWGGDLNEVADGAEYIREIWNDYSDESVGILARTTDPHNAITPIARKIDDTYTMDLLLRNNRTDETYPDGIFHAHPEYHNIKKEGIGLIEAMGLFILPGRLDKECGAIKRILCGEKVDYLNPDDMLYKHKNMIEELVSKNSTNMTSDTADKVIKDYIGGVCENILLNTAVFKDTDEGKQAFLRFMEKAGFKKVGK